MQENVKVMMNIHHGLWWLHEVYKTYISSDKNISLNYAQ
jgi:hypothetical protein